MSPWLCSIVTVPDSQLTDEDWSRFDAIRAAVVDTWKRGTAPDLSDLLNGLTGSVRIATARELVRLDLAERWQRGLGRRLEEYLVEFPELAGNVTPELLAAEFRARKRAGDAVSPTEYLLRFPDQWSLLADHLQVDPSGQTTRPMESFSTVRTAGHPQSGEVIDDFELLLCVGSGTFASVFLARQRSMQRLVAVKVSADEGTEPQTLAQLDHDNIIRVYDQRLVADRGLRLLYMQYASGGNLAEVIEVLQSIPLSDWSGRTFLRAIDRHLENKGESPPSESALRRQLAERRWPQLVCWIGIQLAGALDYAHRRNVLHRDLKPANVLLTAEGLPKLADFNISFAAQLEGAAPEHQFGGSVAYMSPEQLEACNPRHSRAAGSLDGRSDLYSLGVVLWELLTGIRPFDDPEGDARWGTRLEHMTAQRHGGPNYAIIAPLVTTDAPGLDDVLRRCLAPQLADRFPTGRALAFALESCLQPELHRLLAGPQHGWKQFARRAPLWSVIVATIVPNAVAAVFNFLYNYGEIVARVPDAEPTFMRIQTIINLIAFPTGALCAGWLAGSVAKATRVNRAMPLSAETLTAQRRRCLELGHLAVIVSLTLWLVAAPAYPLALHLLRGSVPGAVYVHFIASLALCGLIAAAYPFFGVSLIAVRSFYPMLLEWDSVTRDDVVALERLGRQTWLYLVLAASVPMLSVVCLVLSGQDRRFELVVLSVGGIIGFGIAVSAFRWLQGDIAILTAALQREARS